MKQLQPYQHEFIELALAQGALRFGEFTLKSGRISPYFFNMGAFHSGKTLSLLGTIYAKAMIEKQIQCDMLFGPAYKGICLAAATTIAYYHMTQQDLPYAFNRKEAKNHGEGGQLVGAPLSGRVLIIDDVITAGTAIKEIMPYVNANNADCAGILIALDRQEKTTDGISATAAITQQYQTPVHHIIGLDDLITYLHKNPELSEHIEAIENYRVTYGV